MGWNNPTVPWTELERALSGRPPQARAEDRCRSVRSDEPWTTPVRPGRPAAGRTCTRVPYAELHCHSAFSFLDGASTPEMLVAEALRLGLDALAITDHDGLYGIVRFAEAAADTGLRTLYGAELSLGLPEPQLGVPDPVGDAPAGAGPRPGGLHRGCPSRSAAPSCAAARRAARSTTWTSSRRPPTTSG